MTKIRPSGTATVPAKTAGRFMGFRVLHVPVGVQSGGGVAAGSDCSTLASVGLLGCPWVVELAPHSHNTPPQTNAAESDRGVRMTTPPRGSEVATNQPRKGMRMQRHCRASPREQPTITRQDRHIYQGRTCDS